MDVMRTDDNKSVGISLRGLGIEQAREFGQHLVGDKDIIQPDWQPYVSSYRFGLNPTADVLAGELERLALLTDLPKVPDQELACPLATFY